MLGDKDFFAKPSKVLHLTTSEIATASLGKSFWVRVLLKRERERKPLYSLTDAIIINPIDWRPSFLLVASLRERDTPNAKLGIAKNRTDAYRWALSM